MLTEEPLALLIIMASSLAMAVVSLYLLSLWMPRGQRSALPAGPGDSDAIFLFDGDVLEDATPSARRLLRSGPRNTDDWAGFLALFLPRFPQLEEKLRDADGEGQMTLTAPDKNERTRLDAEWWNGMMRITVRAPDAGSDEGTIDQVSLNALQSELRILRRTAELAPFLVWQESSSGQIVWANRAYLDFAEKLFPETAPPRAWPPRQLFPSAPVELEPGVSRARRISVTQPQDSGRQLWFESFSRRVDDDLLHFAVEADAVVHAETSLRNFIQTLTLTFAHLPTGLAIFDRKRQLTLFNPALTDLLSLPIDFLSSRPTLPAFLDLLREKRMIPEPKDYKSWCLQMDDLEAKAKNGTYEEIWNLPSGQTYRIVGRPHPDGAVAFLFEDISAEVSLTRRFRSQLQVGQAVVDSFDEAVAVFSPTGLLTFSNAAYVDLWGVDPGSAFGEMGINDASRHWQELCETHPLWDRARAFVGRFGERTAFKETVAMNSGVVLSCRFVPLPGGSTLIGFTSQPAAVAQIDSGDAVRPEKIKA